MGEDFCGRVVVLLDYIIIYQKPLFCYATYDAHRRRGAAQPKKYATPSPGRPLPPSSPRVGHPHTHTLTCN